MGGVSFDYHEIHGLVKAFDDATGGPAIKDVEAVVFKGAMNIKRDAAARARGAGQHLRRLSGAVDFQTYRSLRGPAAEIGFNHSKPQGNLGHVPEYGTPTSAPHPIMLPAGEAEEPRFAQALEDLAARAFEQ